MLDAALKSFPVSYGQAASLAGLEAMLTQYYGMRQSIRQVSDEKEYQAIARIAMLSQNNYVVASQMALGAAMASNDIGNEYLRPIYQFVAYALEPYHGNQELVDAAQSVAAASRQIEALSEKPKAFARWVIRAGAYDDPVAFRAAMTGFCSVKPSPADIRILGSAFKTAQSYLRKDYANPSYASGAQKDLNPLRNR